MLVNSRIEMRWENANKKYYINKGYTFTKNGDIFYVDINDLLHASSVKLKIQCDDCGKEYEMSCAGYFKGYEQSIKKGIPLVHLCDECKRNKTIDNLYKKALKACEKRGYIFLSDKSEITCNTSYIRYLCPRHGEHNMRISNFINGKGCPDCVPENNSERFRLLPDEVEARVKECGGNLLNKNDYVNRTEKNLLIECFECGKPFLTSLVLFTQHGGQVCDNCKNTESIGEKRIRHYLKDNKIDFIPQKWFADCRDINPLPFDFYLPDYHTIIEFDGSQHYRETNYFSYSFAETKHHDEIKNNHCKANGIYLIRIPFWKIDKIEQILDKELILHEDIV